MNVEIPQNVRETATQLGASVPYALKVLAGQLADNPDMGEPSALPGILTVAVEGGLYEDCPDLTIGYIREADRIEIRYVNPARASDSVDAQEQDGRDRRETADLAVEATTTAREVVDAWQRITHWLRRNAPDSHAALRAGADPTAIAAVENELGIRIPADLRALWSLTSGDGGVDGAGCLPGNQALMTLDAVAAFYQQQMESQAHQDTLNARRSEENRITVWKAAWIPVVSYGVADRTSGLYLDAATGYLGRWSRYNEGLADDPDTLVTYLEDVADMLEAPALATRDRPGLVGGTLVWSSRIDPAQENRWQALAD